MNDSKAERLAAALETFIQSSPDVEAAAIASFDGLVLASALPEHMDEDLLGVMSAAMLSLGEQAASGLGRGSMKQVFVEGEHGFVFLMSAGGQAVLAAVTSRAARLGFMLYEARLAAERVGDILRAPVGTNGHGEVQGRLSKSAEAAALLDSALGSEAPGVLDGWS